MINFNLVSYICEVVPISLFWALNPLSPNIHIQILQTDLHTSPLRISWENLIKDHRIFSMMIILLILITLSLDHVWILLGENYCWSLLGLKGLMDSMNYQKCVSYLPSTWLANGPSMAFLTDQLWRILNFWYTAGDPEQGFRRCFTDEINQSLVSSVVQARIHLSIEHSWVSVMQQCTVEPR